MQDAELARSFFTDAPNVEVVEIPIRDGWTRDWGPSVRGARGQGSTEDSRSRAASKTGGQAGSSSMQASQRALRSPSKHPGSFLLPNCCALPTALLPCRQFVAKTEGGKRTVAGVHWDYDGYGATLKKVRCCYGGCSRLPV